MQPASAKPSARREADGRVQTRTTRTAAISDNKHPCAAACAACPERPRPDTPVFAAVRRLCDKPGVTRAPKNKRGSTCRLQQAESALVRPDVVGPRRKRRRRRRRCGGRQIHYAKAVRDRRVVGPAISNSEATEAMSSEHWSNGNYQRPFNRATSSIVPELRHNQEPSDASRPVAPFLERHNAINYI